MVNNSARAIFLDYLRTNGIRHSRQKIYILDALLKSKKHLSASEIFKIVRRTEQNIGYATVYRAIKIIEASGILDEIDTGDRVKRFELKKESGHHDHLVCDKCGKLIEVFDAEIEQLQEKMAEIHNFTPRTHRLDIFGVCKKCSKKGK